MVRVRIPLTVGNLQRVAALGRELTAAGCATTITLHGEEILLRIAGPRPALHHAEELLRAALPHSNVDPSNPLPSR